MKIIHSPSKDHWCEDISCFKKRSKKRADGNELFSITFTPHIYLKYKYTLTYLIFIPIQIKAKSDVAAVGRWKQRFYTWETLQKEIGEESTSRMWVLVGPVDPLPSKTTITYTNYHKDDCLKCLEIAFGHKASIETFTQEILLNLHKNNESLWPWNQTSSFCHVSPGSSGSGTLLQVSSNKMEGYPSHLTFQFRLTPKGAGYQPFSSTPTPHGKSAISGKRR